MDEQLQEDWLDRRLREEMPYIDDGGFTARVVQKLPAAQRDRSFRALILLGITMLASAFAYVISDGGWFLVQAAYRFLSMPLLFVSLAAICFTFVMTGFAVSAAVQSVRHR
jgi:hypothetical protein